MTSVSPPCLSRLLSFSHFSLITGAGQDVGRSCVLVTLGGKNIMFDCGMHMGYNDGINTLSPSLTPLTMLH